MADRRDSPPAESRTSSPLSSVPPSDGENIVVAGRGNAQQQVTGGTPSQAQEPRDETVAEPAESAPTTLLAEERALAKRYGSLFAADEEKARRKFEYHLEYAQFTEDAKTHQMKAEHMATRNAIWNESITKNAAEIDRLGARIEELEGANEQMQEASKKMNEDFADDVQAWEEDKEVHKKYDAYFNLESDELDIE